MGQPSSHDALFDGSATSPATAARIKGFRRDSDHKSGSGSTLRHHDHFDEFTNIPSIGAAVAVDVGGKLV
jgi:hypothetical protein